MQRIMRTIGNRHVLAKHELFLLVSPGVVPNLPIPGLKDSYDLAVVSRKTAINLMGDAVGCPACVEAMNLVENGGGHFEAIRVDKQEDGSLKLEQAYVIATALSQPSDQRVK